MIGTWAKFVFKNVPHQKTPIKLWTKYNNKVYNVNGFVFKSECLGIYNNVNVFAFLFKTFDRTFLRITISFPKSATLYCFSKYLSQNWVFWDKYNVTLHFHPLSRLEPTRLSRKLQSNATRLEIFAWSLSGPKIHSQNLRSFRQSGNKIN